MLSETSQKFLISLENIIIANFLIWGSQWELIELPIPHLLKTKQREEYT